MRASGLYGKKRADSLQQTADRERIGIQDSGFGLRDSGLKQTADNRKKSPFVPLLQRGKEGGFGEPVL